MSATPRAPANRAPAQPGPGARLPLAAAVTTGWAAIVSATPVLLAVAAALLINPEPTDAEAVVRGGLAAWLLAHGVPLATGIGPVGLVPLAVTALAAWRVVRAGVHTARATGVRRSGSVLPALRAGGAVGALYGLYGLAVAVGVSTAGLRISAPRAGVTLALFGLVAGLAGALYEGRWPGRLAARVPVQVRDAVRTGGVAALLVLAAGAAASGLALALSAGEAGRMIQQYRAGVVGQAGLLLLCLVYTPNFAVWAAAYLVGPGFSIGAGTTVSAAAVTLGPVPAVPVLAAMPNGPLPTWSGVLLGVPLLAGMVAGGLLARRVASGAASGGVSGAEGEPGAGWGRLLVPAGFAGPVAGVGLALCAVVSRGSLGGGRLVQVGADAWPLAGVSAVVVTAGALVGAAAMKALARIRRG
jgi:hypothetical protein